MLKTPEIDRLNIYRDVDMELKAIRKRDKIRQSVNPKIIMMDIKDYFSNVFEELLNTERRTFQMT